MPRTPQELIAQADQLADKFEAYEPDDADGGEPPLRALRRLAFQRSLVERGAGDPET